MNKKVILAVTIIVLVAVSMGLAYVFVITPEIKLASVTGTYVNPASGASVQVNRDGTVFVQSAGESTGVQGTWTFVNDNTIAVSFILLGTPITNQYHFGGNQLINTANNGNTLNKNGAINNPTINPTEQPTNVPTYAPIPTATNLPTVNPTQAPSQTINPTTQPTAAPTTAPTATPTTVPTTPTPTSSANVAISYNLITEQYYTWTGSSGTKYIQNASTGKVFIQIILTAKNNGYDSFNTNPNYFYLTADNIKYTYDSGTYSVDSTSKWSTVDVLNGGTYTGTILFQVPSSATSFTVGYEKYLTQYNIVWTKT